MAILLSGAALGKSFGARVLFENLSLSLSEGDRTGLIGPNGSGKTTLLEILAGREAPGAGVRALRKQTRLAYVPQDSQFGPDDTAGSVVTAALASKYVALEVYPLSTIPCNNWEPTARPLRDSSDVHGHRIGGLPIHSQDHHDFPTPG